MSEIAGVRVGHWTDPVAATGCTVILPPPGTTTATEARGGGPATRESELLAPLSSHAGVTALLLSGGSAFGLDAAAGVVRWCEQHRLGHRAGAWTVPIVAAACIYDLGVGDGSRRPGPEEGYAAAAAAVPGPHPRGSVGAGAGATVGKLRGQRGWCKGGLGAASRRLYDGTTVAALAVANSWGDVIEADGTVIAGAFDPELGFLGAAERAISAPPEHPRLAAAGNTTLACVVTDARLTKAELGQLARMAHDGFARAVSPVHTPIDGDVVYCMATGARESSLFACGAAASEVVAEAIRDGARSAVCLAGVPTGAERRASLRR